MNTKLRSILWVVLAVVVVLLVIFGPRIISSLRQKSQNSAGQTAQISNLVGSSATSSQTESTSSLETGSGLTGSTATPSGSMGGTTNSAGGSGSVLGASTGAPGSPALGTPPTTEPQLTFYNAQVRLASLKAQLEQLLIQEQANQETLAQVQSNMAVIQTELTDLQAAVTLQQEMATPSVPTLQQDTASLATAAQSLLQNSAQQNAIAQQNNIVGPILPQLQQTLTQLGGVVAQFPSSDFANGSLEPVGFQPDNNNSGVNVMLEYH